MPNGKAPPGSMGPKDENDVVSKGPTFRGRIVPESGGPSTIGIFFGPRHRGAVRKKLFFFFPAEMPQPILFVFFGNSLSVSNARFSGEKSNESKDSEATCPPRESFPPQQFAVRPIPAGGKKFSAR